MSVNPIKLFYGPEPRGQQVKKKPKLLKYYNDNIIAIFSDISSRFVLLFYMTATTNARKKERKEGRHKHTH